ncbi:hypothetical protein ACXIT0_12110 [Methylorubrum extorquens]
MAIKCNENFELSPSDWVKVWRAHPERNEQGYIGRIDSDEPWTINNIRFFPGVSPRRTHSYVPRTGVRILTVKQWVREIRANR